MKQFGILVLLVAAVVVSGCVPTYALVQSGPVVFNDLQVNATGGWNQAPPAFSPSMRKGAAVWTQDGPLLDRLIIIPGVPDGETLIRSPRESTALPVFRKDMLPNEIEELAESTFVKYFGEGNAAITTRNLRPHRFGKHAGVMFNVDASVSESPDYRGTVGAFIANEKLYMLYYLGAIPHYYDIHAADAEAVIQSATLIE